MPFHHVMFTVPRRSFESTVQFYLHALAPLGYTTLMRPVPDVVGMGPPGRPELWMSCKDQPQTQEDNDDDGEDAGGISLIVHIALEASGGKCNGPPGLRPQYKPDYYAAFVHDPIGNNLEVVCIKPDEMS
ncbi:MAG: hypothetical protein M1816_005217 [Peltula sp. TS41687]|nr:MAG: hypothetical protein M1816_005217 [Peltula sp. TS41687]